MYELWFKQMLHDLDSILDIFSQEYIPEKSIGVAVERLGRIVEIQRVLIGQLDVLETMSPVSALHVVVCTWLAGGTAPAPPRHAFR